MSWAEEKAREMVPLGESVFDSYSAPKVQRLVERAIRETIEKCAATAIRVDFSHEENWAVLGAGSDVVAAGAIRKLGPP